MLDFCIYQPGQEDYWGKVSNLNDINQFLDDSSPKFVPHIWDKVTDKV